MYSIISDYSQFSLTAGKYDLWAATWQNQQSDCAPSEDSVWSESSLCVQRVAKDPSFLHADSKDSDQTGRMPRLIWVFSGRTVTLLVLSCRGSYCKNSYNAFFLDKKCWHSLPVCLWGCFVSSCTFQFFQDSLAFGCSFLVCLLVPAVFLNRYCPPRPWPEDHWSCIAHLSAYDMLN